SLLPPHAPDRAHARRRGDASGKPGREDRGPRRSRLERQEATMLHTALTRALGIEHPVVQAGMAAECGAALAAAVSEAGGLGTIGTIGGPPERLAAELEACRAATARPFAVNVVTFDWAPFARELVDVALAGGAPVLTLS